MAKAKNTTTATGADVGTFLEGVASDEQRADARTIAVLMGRLTGEEPRMWGPSIVGFGRYHYRYDSGREGEMCRIGFSPRRGKTVVYIADGFAERDELLDRLGPHTTGKSCLYIRRLSEVDVTVLEEICAESLAEMARQYPGD